MNPKNNHQKGAEKKHIVLEALETWKAMSTSQIKHKCYLHERYDLLTRKLRKLVADRRVKRARGAGKYQLEFYYWLFDRKQPGQPDHLLGINDVRLWVEAGHLDQGWNGGGGRKITSWEYEVTDYIEIADLRPDARFSIYNGLGNTTKTYFLEFDNSDGNDFDKIGKYCIVFDNYSRLVKRDWDIVGGKMVERKNKTEFPTILIVTENRLKTIQTRVNRDNKRNLTVIIKTADEIREALDKC